GTQTSRLLLFRICAIVGGIELCYAAETALVSPIMMKLGTPVYLMSLSWCISPIIGFLLVPLLGSMSDNCRSSLGRRRPFIIGLSACILTGAIILAVVPDSYNISTAFALNATHGGGTVALLDSCCDGCQSPARAFLLDVVPAVDHAAGLTTFTVLAGCGGFFGYLIGSLDWESAGGGGSGGSSFYHEKVVFSLLAVVFTICMLTTVTSVREVPLQERDGEDSARTPGGPADEAPIGVSTQNHRMRRTDSIAEQLPSEVGLKTYLMSIVHMPVSMRLLCLTNLLCWMALVSYSLFFTDFVGQAVYRGNPDSPPWSPEHKRYNAGVRMGSLAMSVYSLVCCVYSLVIDRLINKFGEL
uniref:MFS domain-containing protein n=1 Tax=Macrostomum lignano TaxID=282301 RepID=A0A1I8HNX0_9PLAT